MPNNNLNHNVPGYSGNYDPGPSSHDLPITNNDENPELTISNSEIPFISRDGMVNARNSLEDVEIYRGTLFNLKTESESDRERRKKESESVFLQRCRDPDEIDARDVMDTPEIKLQPKETITEIKAAPIVDVEENLSLEMETEQYPPESYSESVENSSHINTTNPRANVMNEINIPLGYLLLEETRSSNNMMTNSRENESNIIITEQLRESGQIYEINIELPPQLCFTEVLSTDENEADFLMEIEVGGPFEYLSESYSRSIGNSSYAGTTNRRANGLESNRMLRQFREADEMNEINLSRYLPFEESQPEETPSPMDTITEENELGYLKPLFQQLREELDESDETEEEEEEEEEETSSPIDTMTNPREELRNLKSLFQKLTQELDEIDETEQEETSSPIDTMTNPRENKLGDLKYLFQQLREQLEEIDETEQEKTSSPIDTMTNPRAGYLDNGNTNIIENVAVVPKNIRKKKVVSTPNRISTRIKKPKLMYNV